MTDTGWRIGHIGPTPLYLARSWPLGVLLLGLIYFSSLAGTMSTGAATGYALLAVAGLFASVLVHEVSHGLAGLALRRPPQSYTLTLWGGHTTFREAERRPAHMALIALAGPVSNLVLAAILWGVLLLAGDATYWVLAPLAILNSALGVFNLLPGLPMDGGHVVQAIGWAVTGQRDRGMLLAGTLGRVVAVLVGIWGAVPLLQGNADVGSLWPVIIAVFLWQGASQAMRVARARIAVADVDLRPWMVPAPLVDAAARVGDVPPAGAVVLHAGRPVAVVTPEELQRGAPPTLPVTAVARTLPPESVLRVAHGPEAVGGLVRATRGGDVVVLVDGETAWLGHLPTMLQRLPR